MKFTFDQLVGFIAVAEEEHFGRAAERLRLTQPPLSRQIQSLERHLGVELVDRHGRRTRLTAAGRSFLVDARRLVALASAAEQSVTRVADGTKGTVGIGFTSVVGNAVLPQLLKEATAHLHDVQIVLHEIRTVDQAEALLSRTIDLGMSRPFELSEGLISRPLPPDGFVVALPRAFLAEGDDGGSRAELTSIRDLRGHDFVMYAEDGPRHVRDAVESILISYDVRPNYVQSVVEIYTMLRLVDVGIGAAIVPRSTRVWGGENTVFVELPELDDYDTRAVVTYHAGSANPALPRMLSLLEQIGAL